MYDKRSFLKGLALGLAGKPLEFAPGKEPVAYLYNGVRLPKLPEHDEAHKYAAMGKFGNIYRLILSTVPLIHKSLLLSAWQVKTNEDGESLTYQCAAPYDPNEPLTWNWEQQDTTTHTAGGTAIFVMAELHWADYDICKESGTVYLAASEPVPIYE